LFLESDKGRGGGGGHEREWRREEGERQGGGGGKGSWWALQWLLFPSTVFLIFYFGRFFLLKGLLYQFQLAKSDMIG
jgi:hypothetical protein